MDYKLVNTNFKPNEKILFLGKKSNIIRVDLMHHPTLKHLKEMSENNTWFTKVIDYKMDKARFDTIEDEDAKRAFKLNIAYQTIMDSGVSEGIPEVIKRFATCSILNILYSRISIEEVIHSESYSYGLQEVFGQEAEEILNLVYEDEHVKRRMEIENEIFAELHKLKDYEDDLLQIESDENNNTINAYTFDSMERIENIKEKLLKVLIGVNCLEGIKFPFSFLVTFMINDRYNNAIPGFTKTLQLIAHDELNMHVPTFHHIIKILKEDEVQGFTNYFKENINNPDPTIDSFTKSAKLDIDELFINDDSVNEETKKILKDMKRSSFDKWMIDFVNKTVNSEIEWAKYLLEDTVDGNTVQRKVRGLNTEIAIHFIKYRARKMLEAVDIFDNDYMDIKESDIEKFFDNYRNINMHNSALQEISNNSYQKGNTKNDLDERFKNEFSKK